MRLKRLMFVAWLATAATRAMAAPPVDAGTLNKIADEGFNHGQVVTTAAHLADEIGGRMTNSPAMRKAEQWTQSKFKEWGLKNVHPEAFDFGRGWWIEASQARMVAPRPLALLAIPVAWTPATNGPLSAPIVVAPLRTVKDFDTWKGKLAGKIVLVTWPEPVRDDTEPPFERLSPTEIAKRDVYKEPDFDPEIPQKLVDRLQFRTKLDAFLASEGALAWVSMSRTDGRRVHGEGYSFQVGASPKLPAIEMASEDYRRLTRLAKVGEVRLEIDNRVHYEDADHHGYNILAEIPGKDPKAGYVMAGAHLDSWVAGDGAADNGAGSAIVMEAARILAALNVAPKRTVRFALWAGEEQGLFGSSAYLSQHLAKRPVAADPAIAAMGAYFGPETYPVEPLPGYKDLAAYFNVDNGSGKFRGIYAEDNFAVMPVFHEWLAPFESMGAAAVVAEPTGSTDHELMSRVGLPAFQFIQDPLDYESRVHHTDIDTFDHLRADDMRQASVILATVLLDAANNATPLPGKPVPTQPVLTDPFHYTEPSKP